MAAWKAHNKHIFILSSSGRPIWWRFGTELEVTPLCGTLQALIARSMETKDPLDHMLFGGVTIVFLHRGPLSLVAASKTGEPVGHLRAQLQALFDHIIFTLTVKPLRLLAANPSYNLRMMLHGTQMQLQNILRNANRSPSLLLGVTPILPLRPSHRTKLISILRKTKTDYAFVIAGTELVAYVGHAHGNFRLTPKSFFLLLNFVQSSPGLRTADAGLVPLCIPSVSSVGYLHAMVHFLGAARRHPGRPSASYAEPIELLARTTTATTSATAAASVDAASGMPSSPSDAPLSADDTPDAIGSAAASASFTPTPAAAAAGVGGGVAQDGDAAATAAPSSPSAAGAAGGGGGGSSARGGGGSGDSTPSSSPSSAAVAAAAASAGTAKSGSDYYAQAMASVAGGGGGGSRLPDEQTFLALADDMIGDATQRTAEVEMRSKAASALFASERATALEASVLSSPDSPNPVGGLLDADDDAGVVGEMRGARSHSVVKDDPALDEMGGALMDIAERSAAIADLADHAAKGAPEPDDDQDESGGALDDADENASSATAASSAAVPAAVPAPAPAAIATASGASDAAAAGGGGGGGGVGGASSSGGTSIATTTPVSSKRVRRTVESELDDVFIVLINSDQEIHAIEKLRKTLRTAADAMLGSDALRSVASVVHSGGYTATHLGVSKLQHVIFVHRELQQYSMSMFPEGLRSRKARKRLLRRYQHLYYDLMSPGMHLRYVTQTTADGLVCGQATSKSILLCLFDATTSAGAAAARMKQLETTMRSQLTHLLLDGPPSW